MIKGLFDIFIFVFIAMVCVVALVGLLACSVFFTTFVGLLELIGMVKSIIGLCVLLGNGLVVLIGIVFGSPGAFSLVTGTSVLIRFVVTIFLLTIGCFVLFGTELFVLNSTVTTFPCAYSLVICFSVILTFVCRRSRSINVVTGPDPFKFNSVLTVLISFVLFVLIVGVFWLKTRD